MRKSRRVEGLEGEATVHVGLARVQLGVEEELAVERAVREPHGGLGPRRPAKTWRRPSASIDLEPADAHERPQHMGQGKHAGLRASPGLQAEGHGAASARREARRLRPRTGRKAASRRSLLKRSAMGRLLVYVPPAPPLGNGRARKPILTPIQRPLLRAH